MGKSSWPWPHCVEERRSSAAGLPPRICSFWQASGVCWISAMDVPPGPGWCGITLYRWSRHEGEVVLLRRACAMLLVTPHRTYVLTKEWSCKGASDSEVGHRTSPESPPWQGGTYCLLSLLSASAELKSLCVKP